MKKRGFTLIELMIVVLVIGILAAVGIPKYQSFVIESRARACMSQLKSIDQAIGVWETKNVSIGFNDQAEIDFRPSDGYITGTQYRKWTGGAYLAWISNPPDLLPQAIGVGGSDGSSILQIVKDGRAFACPEVVQKYGGQQNVPNDWRVRYSFYKVAPQSINDNWATDWVPKRIGRAVTCFAFGYNWNDGLVTGGWWGVMGPAGNQFYPGWGDPNHSRDNLHLQWNSR